MRARPKLRFSPILPFKSGSLLFRLVLSEIKLEQAKKSLYKEIQQAYYNAVAASRQCESSDEALSSANAAFILMQRKYENGKATVTEFQDAKTKYMSAESQQIQSRYTYLFRKKILDFYRGKEL